MWTSVTRINAILIFACALLPSPVKADRFNNTGSGTINACDPLTRVGIGITSHDSMTATFESNLILGMNDQGDEGYEGGQLQLNTTHNDSGVAAFIDNYLVDGHTPVLRFLAGTNLYGSSEWKAQLKLSTGDFTVTGGLYANSITVTSSDPPDYVFEPSYELPRLEKIERFVKVNKHLPGIPSASELSNGMNLANMNLQLLRQVEELTLHAIDLEKRIKRLEKKLQKQEVGYEH